MDEKKIGAITEKDQPISVMMQLMLSPYDALTEIDLVHNRIRSLHSVADKYFAPVPDGEVKDIIRYNAEYMIHPDDREVFIEANDMSTLAERVEHSQTPGMVRNRYRYKLIDGGWRWVERIVVGGERHGLPNGVFYSFIFDLEEMEAAETERTSNRNALTGLLVEEPFFRQSAALIKEHPEGWCLLAVDLEHFKLFNDWYGRKQGDLLLAIIGAKMAQLENETGGLACYMGQDDFCVLMPYDMERIDRLYSDIHELIMDYGTSVGFLPAFGIAPVISTDPIYEIYDHAALTTRKAKESYHTRICAFDPDMYRQTEREYRILSDFHRALKDHELYIQLQPQCHITTGRIVGAESLVRWRKASGEMVSPAIFVPVLEKYGFVTDLDKYVWEEVCIWQKRWFEGGHTPLPVSVNVSQIDIYTIDVPDHFAALLERYRLPVDVVKIEITESAYVDDNKVVDTVQRLREKGFLVLMDDFGSGYSSLNMLRSLNVDIIKLDAQFLRMNDADRKGIHILESIVNMVKTMGLPIIVEGVETREQANFLAGLGCRYVQGYFFYRPMAVEDFEKLIMIPQNTDSMGFQARANEELHFREFLDENIYSDSMLNNILGPVAFFSWHGEDVDIVRFNQKFWDEVRVPDLNMHLDSIQRYVVKEDLPALFNIMERAVNDRLNGAHGVLRFELPDGTVSQVRFHFYFLEEDESGKKFYGSVHDLTQFITLNDHMRLLSQVSTDSIVFVRRRANEWSYRVVVHGLGEVMGLSWEEFQQELNDGSFYQRISTEERERLRRFSMGAKDCVGTEAYSEPFHMVDGEENTIELRLKADYVHDKTSGVEYILTLRENQK